MSSDEERFYRLMWWKVPGWLSALVCSLVLMLCLCGGLPWPADFALNLAFGWVMFLVRVVPEITVNWGSTLTAMACLAGLGYGMHRFLTWFYAKLPTSSSEEQPARQWRFRWTLSILAVVVLMFVAGISAVGVSHQAAWLVTSPDRLVGGGGREAAMRMRSSNNLRQLGIAHHSHQDQFTIPPPGVTTDPDGRLLHGWMTHLLPFVEQDPLYRTIDLTKPWDDPQNAPRFRVDVSIYRHLAVKQLEADGFAAAHYAGNVHVIGREKALSLTKKDFTDGTGYTILAGEAAGNFKPWGYPMGWRDPAKGVNQSPDGFGSPYGSTDPRGSGTLFVFADGHVSSISSTVSPEVLKALSTPNGGEPVPVDY